MAGITTNINIANIDTNVVISDVSTGASNIKDLVTSVSNYSLDNVNINIKDYETSENTTQLDISKINIADTTVNSDINTLETNVNIQDLNTSTNSDDTIAQINIRDLITEVNTSSLNFDITIKGLDAPSQNIDLSTLVDTDISSNNFTLPFSKFARGEDQVNFLEVYLRKRLIKPFLEFKQILQTEFKFKYFKNLYPVVSVDTITPANFYKKRTNDRVKIRASVSGDGYLIDGQLRLVVKFFRNFTNDADAFDSKFYFKTIKGINNNIVVTSQKILAKLKNKYEDYVITSQTYKSFLSIILQQQYLNLANKDSKAVNFKKIIQGYNTANITVANVLLKPKKQLRSVTNNTLDSKFTVVSYIRNLQDYIHPTDDYFGFSNIDDDQTALIGKILFDIAEIPTTFITRTIFNYNKSELDLFAYDTDNIALKILSLKQDDVKINSYLSISALINKIDEVTIQDNFLRQFSAIREFNEIIETNTLIKLVTKRDFIDNVLFSDLNTIKLGVFKTNQVISNDSLKSLIYFNQYVDDYLASTDDFLSKDFNKILSNLTVFSLQFLPSKTFIKRVKHTVYYSFNEKVKLNIKPNIVNLVNINQFEKRYFTVKLKLESPINKYINPYDVYFDRTVNYKRNYLDAATSNDSDIIFNRIRRFNLFDTNSIIAETKKLNIKPTIVNTLNTSDSLLSAHKHFEFYIDFLEIGASTFNNRISFNTKKSINNTITIYSNFTYTTIRNILVSNTYQTSDSIKFKTVKKLSPDYSNTSTINPKFLISLLKKQTATTAHQIKFNVAHILLNSTTTSHSIIIKRIYAYNILDSFISDHIRPVFKVNKALSLDNANTVNIRPVFSVLNKINNTASTNQTLIFKRKIVLLDTTTTSHSIFIKRVYNILDSFISSHVRPVFKVSKVVSLHNANTVNVRPVFSVLNKINDTSNTTTQNLIFKRKIVLLDTTTTNSNNLTYIKFTPILFIDNATISQTLIFKSNTKRTFTDQVTISEIINYLKYIDKKFTDTIITSGSGTTNRQDYFATDYVQPGYAGTNTTFIG